MKIKFNKIEIENFLSIGKSTIELNNRGFVRVVGINNYDDDNSTSNGSGKSSIFEALVWCLTGDTIRGTNKNIVNINAQDGAVVTLYFDVDSDNFVVTRSKNHSKFGTNLKIICNNNDVSGKGIRDSEKILSQYLPDLTSELIGSVIVLGQGLPQRFTNNTPSGRKEVLEKLSKSDFMIDDLKVRIDKRQGELNKQLKQLNDELIMQSSKRISIENWIKSDEAAMTMMPSDEDLTEQIALLQEDYDILHIDCDDLQSQLDNCLEFLKQCKKKSVSLIEEKIKLESDIQLDYANKISDIRVKVAEISSYIKQLNDKIKEYENITDICPTCGQRLIGVTKPDTTRLYEECSKYKLVYDSYCNQIAQIEFERNDKLDKVLKGYNNQLNELERLVYEPSEKRYDIERALKKKSEEIRQKEVQIHNKLHDSKVREETLKMFQDRIDANKSELSQLDEKILYNTNERDMCEKHADVIAKFKTIITRDFRGYLLKNVIDYINLQSKKYAMLIFGTDELSFELNGNNIDISYNEKMYENLSGGERQKVDLIVQLSLRDMLCNYLNFSSNILVVDEIFDNLDAFGCDKVVNMISQKLSDIDSVYIITHHSTLNLPYDDEITVVKDKQGVSSVV